MSLCIYLLRYRFRRQRPYENIGREGRNDHDVRHRRHYQSIDHEQGNEKVDHDVKEYQSSASCREERNEKVDHDVKEYQSSVSCDSKVIQNHE